MPGRGVPPPPKKRRKRKQPQERQVSPAVAARPKDLPPVPETITLSEGVTVKELAEKLNRKSKDVIAKLIGRGVLATINQPLEPTTAIDVAKEFGSAATIISFEEEAQQAATLLTPEQPEITVADEPANLSLEFGDAHFDRTKSGKLAYVLPRAGSESFGGFYKKVFHMALYPEAPSKGARRSKTKNNAPQTKREFKDRIKLVLRLCGVDPNRPHRIARTDRQAMELVDRAKVALKARGIRT